ncbi:hypothetical protein ScPMuIL_001100 [Solemya velum]
MGNGMDKIVTGLYVGNYRDARDEEQIKNNNITHILAIHDDAKKLVEGIEYLCIIASDNAGQELTQFFPECSDFIHKARLAGGGVLVHCLAGVSRSVTVTTAYLMSVTNLGWRDTLNSIRGSRTCANPNYGFQKQLQKREKRMLDKFPENTFNDEEELQVLLKRFQRFVLFGEKKDEDDGLYPLPPGAYKERVHKKYLETRKKKEESEDVTADPSRPKVSSQKKDDTSLSEGPGSTEATNLATG